jgi:hypothetical protein
MPTSHYCNGKWRDGPASGCSRHQKLSKTQTTVYRGVGEPGGKSAKKAGGTSAAPSDPAPSKPKPSGDASSGSRDS